MALNARVNMPCSRCLRALERQIGPERIRQQRLCPSFPAQKVFRRHLHGSRSALFASPSAASRPTPKVPPAPPTTNPSVTSNITSDVPDTSLSQELSPAAPSPGPPEPQFSSISSSVASKLRQSAFRTQETYVAFSVCSELFSICSSQAAYTITQSKGAYNSSDTVPKTATGEDLGVPDTTHPGTKFWHAYLGLPPTFSTWSQVTFLHMYLATVRLRALDRDSFDTYMQHLINAFSYGTEERMQTVHGIESRSVRNKYLKDLFVQWRGLLAAYDEGMVKGDAVLGAAVWRNLWKAENDVDWGKVVKVVEYLRRVCVEYGNVEDSEMLFALMGLDEGFDEQIGQERFGLFERVQELVMGEGDPDRIPQSTGMKEPL